MFENSPHAGLSPAALVASETAQYFEHFKRLRVFHFIHHFCGTAPFGLGEAIVQEAKHPHLARQAEGWHRPSGSGTVRGTHGGGTTT
eukprot:11682668-Heterocapsa_arctica.AAC.2